ncbi:family 43 glycosylhydrolase [Maribellus comscasis]|uniref:Family 43 glycosylhydrolase n=1 Tax=Maribellus comscasis TaxID=2681766 RepID=A0A6I6K291_9BACT|nr:glycoside hydrolase family protein [Maribellus comscasis]QGY45633.1 family 43 glycosylhydrolase [Maribellus comscasis]
MKKICSQIVFLFFLSFLFSCSPEQQTEPGKLNLANMFQPVLQTGKFIDPDWFIWGGSLVKSNDDGKYHMYYSRWPQKLGMSAWVTHSEIAHAVSDSPLGPFEFADVALPFRGREYWDGAVTHNPTIHFFNGKYYLYYMGTTGDPEAESQRWEHRNRQQIGVAVAENPGGPWKRFDTPLISVSPDSTAHDALMVSNPSVTQMPDGKYLMVYKAAAKKLPKPMSGPVVHLTATADNPEGPFVKQMKPIFTDGEAEFPAEDPYVWFAGNCYYAIVKDMHGAFTDAGRSLVLFYSANGMDWKLAEHPLVSKLEINWENDTLQKVMALERPQLLIENGKPTALLCAVNEIREHSFNLQIPLLTK